MILADLASAFVVPISLAIAVLWGVQPIVHKHLMSVAKVDPKAVLVVGGAAYTSCLICFYLFYRSDVISEVRRLDWRTIGVIALLSIMTAFTANLLYLYVLQKNSSYVVTALMYSSPVVTLVLAVGLLGEKMTVFNGLGTIFVLLGVLCLAKQ